MRLNIERFLIILIIVGGITLLMLGSFLIGINVATDPNIPETMPSWPTIWHFIVQTGAICGILLVVLGGILYILLKRAHKNLKFHG